MTLAATAATIGVVKFNMIAWERGTLWMLKRKLAHTLSQVNHQSPQT